MKNKCSTCKKKYKTLWNPVLKWVVLLSPKPITSFILWQGSLCSIFRRICQLEQKVIASTRINVIAWKPMCPQKEQHEQHLSGCIKTLNKQIYVNHLPKINHLFDSRSKNRVNKKKIKKTHLNSYHYTYLNVS